MAEKQFSASISDFMGTASELTVTQANPHPNQGASPAMKKFLKFGCLGIIVLAVLAAVISAIGGGGNSANKDTATTNPSNAPTSQSANSSVPSQPEATAAVAPSQPESTVAPTPVPAVGQDVKVDQVRWKILSAKDLGNRLKSDNQFIEDKTTTGRFVSLRFEVENLSKDMLTFAGFDLVDDQGRTYTRSSDVFMLLPTDEVCMLENLNPNVAKICTAVYEVPANAENLRAKVGDLKFGGKETLIDLGLK